ncbi:MAG: hypothetical protein ACHQT7_00010 [Candidatus Levyibacteriota bacterium]
MVFPGFVYAQDNSFITIVNPQRISNYTKDYLGSFQAEVNIVESRSFAATWPVTYDVLTKNDFVDSLKKLDSNQELGIFLEVTPQFAHDSNVTYNNTDSWHRATSLFLSGYTQTDRKKLIDTVFKKFKEDFGYYPKSVGSWWTDAYSLSYMQKNYGITGTLNVSDQYDLDGYQVWGTWWSVPYYPNSINAAEPAQNVKNKLDVVTFRWAFRDPLNGYTSPSRFPASMYSSQDYSTIGIDPTYFDRLIQIFALQQPQNKFGQATIGGEGDLGAADYKIFFARQLDTVKNLENEGSVSVLTMQQFSSWYRKSFPDLSPNHMIQADDPLGIQNKKAIWMQTPFYRIGLVYDAKTQETQVVDARAYQENFMEPFLLTPNKQLNLSINLPFVIDSVIKPSDSMNFSLGKLNNINQDSSLSFEKGTILFQNDKVVFPQKTLFLHATFPVSASGITYRDYSLTIPFSIKRRIPFPPEYFLVPFIIVAGLMITFLKKRGIVFVIGCILLLGIASILIFPDYRFYISQTEINALQVLKGLPPGKVLVYDKNCLKCTFSSQFKPAAAGGKKSYVAVYSNKPVDIDISFLLSKTSTDARKVLRNNGIRYVYLAKYEDYIESLPYLPQDLGLKRVYENANAEIWEITSP